MLRFRTDLPLDRDTTARFLPWIIGFMVYLAMIAATVALLVDHVTQRWQRDLSGQLTVELPGVAGEDAAQRQQRVDAALEEITDTNGIIGTRVLDEVEVKRLLQPWLGDQADQLGVTLPDLVAVSVQPDIRPNLSELAERLQEVSPGAAIDDHAQFNAGALNFLRTIEVLAVSLLGLVLVATAGLQPSSKGVRVRLSEGKVNVTDGPFAEGKEHIGGFVIIKAPDLDAALEWGRKLARAVALLPIEVRPLQGEVED